MQTSQGSYEQFIRDIELHTVGSVGGLNGRREDTEMFFGFTSFTYPFTAFHYDFNTDEVELFRKPEVDFDPSQYETKQVFCPSKDGTKIPVFITHKKGIKLDGSNPTILYGYGGFNVSLTPRFRPSRFVWLERGGVVAIPNLRGGGEYGEAWHQAGMREKKQNVFDDFIAAAEYLPKPAREPYETLCALHAIDPKCAIMIDDIARNLEPASALGMTTVWMQTGAEWARDVEPEAHIDHVVRDILSWVEGIAERNPSR